MPSLILVNSQICQTPESTIMNHRVHCFHDLGLSYFYRIKAMSLTTADHLRWTKYVKTKSLAYMCIKKLAQTFTGLATSHQVNRNCISFIFVFYPFSFTSQRYSNTTMGKHNGRLFNVNQSLSPPKVIKISIKMKMI